VSDESTRPNLKNRYQALWEFQRGVAVPASYPTVLQIALNNLCNFKCVYCTDQREGNTIPRSQLDGRTWEDVLHALPFAETLAFHGISEFFVDKKFFDLVERCAAAGANLSLNTNGSVATPKHVEVLTNYPGHLEVNFSIDAATREVFTRIRGWDFDRVIRNIRTYVESFKARKHSTHTSVSFVITRSNVHELVPFVRLAKDLGVREVKFYRLHEYGTLAWEIVAPDGKPFDYRSECTDHFKELYNEHVRAATAAAEELGLSFEMPALYSDAELAESR
jgi:MoaA/NifB/PqqE/SkfB family radical SAM enzyme